MTDVTYRIQESPNVNFIVVHVDHLKPYFGEIPEKWILNESLNEDENEISLDQSNYDTQNTDDNISYHDNSVEDNLSVLPAPQTPSPVPKSRCGRTIKKPQKYSP